MARKTFPETATETLSRVQSQTSSISSVANQAVGQATSLAQSAAGQITSLANTAGQTANQAAALAQSTIDNFGISGTGASLNPNANFITQFSQQFEAAQQALAAKLPAQGSFLDKEQLDKTVDQLSGAVGSALNGATAGLNAVGDLGSAIGGQVGEITSGIGGLASRFKTTVEGGISTAQNALAGVSNLGSDISGALNKLTGGNLAGGLQDFAGAISGAAGQLNNILSLFRASNLPEGGELFKQESSPVKLAPNNKDDWRVRINTNWQLFGENVLFSKLAATGGVVFPYLPTITFSTKANYSTVEAIHNNYPFQAYKNSAVDDITITGEFSSETELDAAYWIAATTFFKTATKMFFGSSSNAGNPPIICTLSGYGSNVFDRIPVVIKSFSVDLKDDTNYVKCNAYGTSTWVPILSTITITVSPIYNRTNLRKFKLDDYARGNLVSPNGVGYL